MAGVRVPPRRPEGLRASFPPTPASAHDFGVMIWRVHVLILPVASVLFTTTTIPFKGRCRIYVRLTSSVRQCRISAISSNCSIVIAGVVQAHVYIGYLNSALKQAPSGCVISSLVDVIVVHSSSVCEAGVPCEAWPSSRCSRTSAR